jgi:hypothetical protein
MSEDPILKLEEALRKFWMDYGRAVPIKGTHTEILIEPRFFLNGEINPEVADLLISVFLSQTTREDVRRGRVTVRKGVITIKDKYGQPMAEVCNQQTIREFTSRLGL